MGALLGATRFSDSFPEQRTAQPISDGASISVLEDIEIERTASTSTTAEITTHKSFPQRSSSAWKKRWGELVEHIVLRFCVLFFLCSNEARMEQWSSDGERWQTMPIHSIWTWLCIFNTRMFGAERRIKGVSICRSFAEVSVLDVNWFHVCLMERCSGLKIFEHLTHSLGIFFYKYK